MKKTLLGVLAVFVVVLMTGRSINSPFTANAAPGIPTSLPSQDVQFKMPDGLVIKGTFYPSSASDPAPAVLLLHQYGGNRRQWDPFTNALTAKGYNVLAIDQRGFGETGGNIDWILGQHDA